ncbi:hypothetical protein MRY87_03355 [bacterium]|nr:hypothetical protein [bacterium]
MAQKGTLLEYSIIVLLATGITVLGAHDLSLSKKVDAVAGSGADRPVITTFLEDPSTLLTEGTPAEQIAPKSESEAKARYPWGGSAERVRKGPVPQDDAPERVTVMKRVDGLLRKIKTPASSPNVVKEGDRE